MMGIFKKIVYLLFLLSGWLAAVEFTSSNLPIVIIDTQGQNIRDDIRIVAQMGIIYNGEGQRNTHTDPFNNYEGKIAIEIRGSSSQMFPKKQYALETQDDLGNNRNVSLLGMPEENDWILYAPYSDKSLMRNVLAYKLSWDLGRYASRTRFCELILNNEYVGVYVLMEKIKRDNNRVNISTLNPDEISGDDLTGGYIVKIDKAAGESVAGWISPFLPYPGSRSRIFYQYHYPKPDLIVPEQETYIKNSITQFETVMYRPDYDDPVSGYENYIDVNSFIDFFILNEISKNVDGYRLSTFFYKDKDSIDDLIYIGPLWDFNLAFGNANYYDGGFTDGWQVEINGLSSFANDGFKIPFWWDKLMADSSFINQLQCRWRSLRENIFSSDRLLGYIDSTASVLDEAQTRNFERWPILDSYIWPNRVWLGTYPKELVYLKGWLETRMVWIDENLTGECLSSVKEHQGGVPDEFSLNQNYPNPFNPITNIEYRISKFEFVTLKIYNMLGQEVATLVSEWQPVGYHQVQWDASGFVSGVYLYRLSTNKGFTQTKKLVIIK